MKSVPAPTPVWLPAALPKGGRTVLCCLLCALLGLCTFQNVLAQANKDLPGPTANFTVIPDGSLVIAMDNTNQALVAPFNLKAYGLVNDLLQHHIPVMWAIRAGKAKDGVDFTAMAQRISPTTMALTSYNFAGGPFIVHRDFAAVARTRIAAFANQVAVYELQQNSGQSVTVDIRYQLTLTPRIAVSNVNTTIHSDILIAAGILNYTVIDPTSLSAASCYTSHSEPHTTVTAGVPDVKNFVQSGGNFLGQCQAVTTFENVATGRLQSTLGFVANNLNDTLTYPNADLSYSQFVGALDPDPGGSERDYRLAAGSVFQNNAHIHADNVGASPQTFAASLAKLYNSGSPGGLVAYLGGHNYNSTTNITNMNGRRMYLNFTLTPSTRPVGCGLDFANELRLISGTVYEDVNGDSSLADGLRAQSVNVRLYADVNNNGVVDTGDTYLAATTTNLNGDYSLEVSALATGNTYLVAVDSKSVAPGAGLTAGRGQAWAEQTYGDNSTTSSLDVGARFGGRQPGVSDNFVTADTTPANNNYQHLARADVSSGNITNANFGFSFNVVTNLRAGDAADDDAANTSRTVQGSLRQFIQNANAVTGPNVMRFVPAVALNAGAYWQLSITNTLPALIDGNTTIDGTAYDSTNGTSVRDTNAGQLGAGGTVGVGALPLSQVARPELEIVDGSATAIGLDVQASNTTIRRLALYGFGNVANNDAHANIRVGNNFSNTLLEQNVLGASAAAFTDPGASRSGGDNIRSAGADNGIVRNNLIGFSAGNGVELGSGSSGWLVENNEVRGNGINNSDLGGLDSGNTSGTNTIRGNLFTGNEAAGVDCYQSSGGNLIQNNTINGNGIGAGASVETPGIRLDGAGNTVDLNIITANYGAGVTVIANSSSNRISQNSIFGNGTILNKAGASSTNQIGIDLLSAGDNQNKGTNPFVTINDAGDADAGGNGLLNFPVLVSAQVLGGNLVLTGYARPGANLELFIAESPVDGSGFGEGKTYLLTLIEGSAADTDTTSGTYTSPVNGLAVGTDTTNKFRFSIPLPAGVGLNSILTATATVGSNTSEFSGNVTVAAAQPDVSLVKACSSPPNCTTQPQLPNTDLTYLITYSNAGGSGAQNFVLTDPVSANTDFKIGSVITNLGTTGLTVAIAYSNDGGTTWTYTPASGAGGAPAGYDRTVTHIRWTFTGNLSQTGPNNTGDVGFIVRIR